MLDLSCCPSHISCFFVCLFFVLFGVFFWGGGVRVVHLFSFLCCVFNFLSSSCVFVCPMLPVEVDCQLLICPSVFSDVYKQTPYLVEDILCN